MTEKPSEQRVEELKQQLYRHVDEWAKEFGLKPWEYWPNSVSEESPAPHQDPKRYHRALQLRRVLLARDPHYFDDECFRSDLWCF